MRQARVIIVEDDALTARNLERALESMGHDICLVTGSCKHALAEAGQLKPDLVLMDIRLPDGDGVVAARELRLRHGLPILLVTAMEYHDPVAMAEVEPVGFLLKPFSFDELCNVVEIALHKAAMEKRLKDAEHIFRSLAEAIPQGVAIVRRGQGIYSNQAMREVFGEPGPKRRPDSFLEHVHPLDREFVREQWDDWMIKGSFREQSRFRAVDPQGRVRLCEASTRPVTVEGQEALLVIIDVGDPGCEQGDEPDAEGVPDIFPPEAG